MFMNSRSLLIIWAIMFCSLCSNTDASNTIKILYNKKSTGTGTAEVLGSELHSLDDFTICFREDIKPYFHFYIKMLEYIFGKDVIFLFSCLPSGHYFEDFHNMALMFCSFHLRTHLNTISMALAQWLYHVKSFFWVKHFI